MSHGLPRVAALLRNFAHVLAGEQWLRTTDSVIPPLPDIEPITTSATWHEKENFTLAHAYKLMREHKSAAAGTMLKKAIETSKRHGLMRSVLRFRLARASLMLADNQVTEAIDEMTLALRLGAQQGAKQVFAHHINPAIADIITGIVNSSPQSLGRLKRFAGTLGLGRAASDQPMGTLSAREQEVLAALAEGGSDKVLGRMLGITEHGVRFHLKNIYRKLNVHDRASAIHKGRNVDLI